MEWIVFVAAVGFCFYYFVMKKSGGLEFWQLAARYPSEAMTFFAKNDCFFVDISGNVDKKTLGPNWVGPFLFAAPSVGHSFKIYARAPDYLVAQKEFLSKFGG